MTISFIGSAINAATTGATVDVSGTGRLSGDIIILIDHAYNAIGTGTPADVVPAGFTEIATATSNPFETSFAVRINASWKISNGSEGVLTGMAADTEHDIEALVFRSTVGWGTPAGHVNDFQQTSNLTVTSPGGVFVMCGAIDAFNSTNDYVSSPSPDATIYNNNGSSSTAGYNIFNSAPSNVVLTGSSNRDIKQGFVVPESGGADTLMGQAVF